MFRKYPSIENSYQRKTIDYFLRNFPELADEWYILQEKIHGTNMQIIAYPLDAGVARVEVGTRNRVLKGEDHFGFIANVIDSGDYDHILNPLMCMADDMGCAVNAYCEWFGRGIMKGVDYGDKKRLRFFDMAINGELVPPHRMEEIFDAYGVADYIIPTIVMVQGLENAIQVKVDVPTRINFYEDNIMEGVVIKPYHRVFKDKVGKTFMLKKKNAAFEEKMKKPKRDRVPKEVDPVVQAFKEEFGTYITDMRLQGIFSKYGEIQEKSQLGDYIKYMLNDAKEDFFKENDLSGLNKKDEREVFNFGKVIAKMIMEYL